MRSVAVVPQPSGVTGFLSGCQGRWVSSCWYAILALLRGVAFLVGLGYGFCGFYTAHAGHTTVLNSFSFVPWSIWRLDVALTSLRFRPAAQAGALWGLSALGGYPAIVILGGGMLFLWGLGRCCSSRNRDKPITRDQPIGSRFRFTFFALATVFTSEY